MRKLVAFAACAAMVGLTSSTLAASIPKRVMTKVYPGWDNFAEPLDAVSSNVVWTLNPSARTLNVSFFLVNAQPRKLYQVGAHFFCASFPATFGQLPNDKVGGGACDTLTRQSVTKKIAAFEFGVVTTDSDGNGRFDIDIGPIAPATYKLQFVVRDGAGCNLTGGGPSCAADFQSPGPNFGTPTTIVVP